MNKKPFTPNFNTAPEKLCKEEQNKLASKNSFEGAVKADFADQSRQDIPWESEALAKSHGVYLEFNRAIESGAAKEWIYLIRISIPGGGPLSREQYNVIDDLASLYTKDPQGMPSIRLTNRQNIQLHWVRKEHVPRIIKTVAEAGFNSLNGCGDNTRNVMSCPLSRFSTVFNGNEWSRKAADYFQLPVEPFISVWEIDPAKIRKPGESFLYGKNLLNRKFKIGFSSVLKDPLSGALRLDNCIEVLTDDMGIVPIIDDGRVERFQIYLGGGQGERNGKPSTACFGTATTQVCAADLLKTMDAALRVHQQWGDRENRVWARVKYVIKKMGVEWYRAEMEKILGQELPLPLPNVDPGVRHLHHGWFDQGDGRWTFGAFIENGRLIDNSPNGRLKSMCRHLVNAYDCHFLITPNQDALFANIPADQKTAFEKDLDSFGYGKRNGKEYSTLRLLSGACVGRDTCRLTYTDSEKFEPFLIDDLEAMGWGDIHESIGITGCERQCFRPATKTIGLIGSGLDRYQLKLLGTQEATEQGQPLLSEDGNSIYLRSIPRERVAPTIDVLLKFWKSNALAGESLGHFNQRVGIPAIIQHFKVDPRTADLMAKPFAADCVLE